jgi:hypothetical protein
VAAAHSPEYEKYLNSPAWRMKRMLAIHRAGYQCERCNAENSLQVHHKDYDRLGHERYCDIEVLCPDCHHQADRERTMETEVRQEEARFDGFARKVYGEYYEDSEDKRDHFDNWIDAQRDWNDW